MSELKLTENTFIQIAMHWYDNIQCTTIEEFEEDIKRFMYLRKLFSRYKDNNDLKERLVLNHLIILHNVFGVITPELLFFKIDKKFLGVLATFMLYLNIMPEEIPELDIRLSDLELDQEVITKLRNI